MSITSKLRLARGPLANKPEPPNSFEIGRPYIAEDDKSLWIGQGVNAPMIQIGISGSVDLNNYFQWTQSVAASVWNIPHNLGLSPAVVVQDSTNTQVLVETLFVDENNVQLKFSGAESGRATLIG
jgi:hypothetical protein